MNIEIGKAPPGRNEGNLWRDTKNKELYDAIKKESPAWVSVKLESIKEAESLAGSARMAFRKDRFPDYILNASVRGTSVFARLIPRENGTDKR